MKRRRTSKKATRSRRLVLFLVLLLTASCGFALAGPSSASSLPGAPRVQILSSADILRDHTVQGPAGELFLRQPDGKLTPLVLSPEDPRIPNRGDGAFHAAELEQVKDALLEIRDGFLRDLEVTIYLLPYPRSVQLSSSAEDQVIYLSPGVRDYEPWHVHYLVAHEVGHVVHRRHLPDADVARWSSYRTLRGIADSTQFHAGARHENRPHEIFAEDFRVLFGGPLARGDGAVENTSLVSTEQVDGLSALILELAGLPLQQEGWTLRLSPNPLTRGNALFLRGFQRDAPRALRGGVYDAAGRRVFDLAARSGGEVISLDFVGRDTGGSLLPSGGYWVRLETEDRVVTSLPFRWLR